MADYVTVEAFESIARELAADGIRFMVVGGLAVQAHGYDRVTYDIDLVIQLQPQNVVDAFVALQRVGYHPAVPITASQFADPAMRQRFRDEKGMVVLNFWSDRFKSTKLDVFVAEPFEFDAEYEMALVDRSIIGVELRFPRVAALLAMKRLANRPKDQNDILFLESLDR